MSKNFVDWVLDSQDDDDFILRNIGYSDDTPANSEATMTLTFTTTTTTTTTNSINAHADSGYGQLETTPPPQPAPPIVRTERTLAVKFEPPVVSDVHDPQQQPESYAVKIEHTGISSANTGITDDAVIGRQFACAATAAAAGEYDDDEDMFADESDDGLLARAEAQVRNNRSLIEATSNAVSSASSAMLERHFQPLDDGEDVVEVDTSAHTRTILDALTMYETVNSDSSPTLLMTMNESVVQRDESIPSQFDHNLATSMLASSSPSTSTRSTDVNQENNTRTARSHHIKTPTLEISDGEDDDDVIFVAQVRAAAVPMIDLCALDDSPQPPPAAPSPSLQPESELGQLADNSLAMSVNDSSAPTTDEIPDVQVVSFVLEHSERVENERVAYERECEMARDRQERERRSNERRRVINWRDPTVSAAMAAVRLEAAASVEEARQRADAAEREMSSTQHIHCAVCLESPFARQPAATICGHVFCASCIHQAIKANKKCPLCNRKLTSRQVHPLYV